MQLNAGQLGCMRRGHVARTLMWIVREYHGEEAEPLTPEAARALVDHGVEIARQYGLDEGYPAAILSYLTWQFGVDFQEVIPPMRAIMLDPSIEDRAAALLEMAVKMWDAWEDIDEGDRHAIAV